MYIKPEFKKISSFAHITRGWFWGSCRDVLGARRSSGYSDPNFCGAGGASGW